MSLMDNVLKDIMSLKYEYRSEYIRSHMKPVVDPKHENLIREVLARHLIEIETKIRMYEIAIGNSNFGPVFEKLFCEENHFRDATEKVEEEGATNV